VVVGLLVTGAVPAQAATEVFKERLKGPVVEVFASSPSDDDECLTIDTHVRADRETVQYDRAVFDHCNGELVELEFGLGTPTVFEVTKRATSARLVAEVELLDERTGEPTGEVIDLDLTFTATGRARHVRSSFSETTPEGFKFSTRTIGKFAPATVTGFGDDVQFARIGTESTMFLSLLRDSSRA